MKMEKYFLIQIKITDSGEPRAQYVVREDALIMIARLAEQSQSAILKTLLTKKGEALE